MKTLRPFLTFLFLLTTTVSYAQKWVYDINRTEFHDDMRFEDQRRIIRLPSVNGLLPLKCDFHNHTVFSDGHVWPTARVKEAWQDGLDVLAITDHTSATPSKKNLTGGPNSSYEIAKPEAEKLGLMLIQGTEISRSKPDGGHFNAIFITDATKMTDDFPTEDAIKEAIRQGGYIIWNHPGWAIDTCMMFDINKRLIESGSVHAVEVFNDAEWYPRALSWIRDFKLAPIAASDVHYLTSNFYRLSEKNIRPMTIVLARDKTEAALKEALFSRNTIAFFKDMLAGDSRLLTDFFFASISVKKVSATLDRDKKVHNRYLISNLYDVPFVLQLGDKKITLLANSEYGFSMPAEVKELNVNILNLHIYEFETLKESIKLPE